VPNIKISKSMKNVKTESGCINTNITLPGSKPNPQLQSFLRTHHECNVLCTHAHNMTVSDNECG